MTAAAAGAPVAWRLNGHTVVRRSYTSCNEQTLTITTTRAAAGSSSACARASSNDGPDAIVHFGRLATALGGGGGSEPGPRRPGRLGAGDELDESRHARSPVDTGRAGRASRAGRAGQSILGAGPDQVGWPRRTRAGQGIVGAGGARQG